MSNKTLKEMTDDLSETLISFDKSIENVVILPHYRNKYTLSELDETVVEIKSCLKDLRNAVENINERIKNIEYNTENTNERLNDIEHLTDQLHYED